MEFDARQDEFYAAMPQLLEQGWVRFDEITFMGLDLVPEASEAVFHGRNTGKAVVVVE